MASFQKGVGFLREAQGETGGFPSFVSTDPTAFFSDSESLSQANSVFSSAIILDLLNDLQEDDQSKSIKAGLTKFLLRQKSEAWSFNYWERGSEQARSHPYPDDLDDTACAVAALTRYDSDLVSGAAVAKVCSLLTGVETKEGGPYQTWLVPPEADSVWRDVDLAVNSNIAYFLSLHEVGLPNLIEYIEQRIAENRLSSPYYPSILPVMFFISRWYRGQSRARLIRQLFQQIEPEVETESLNLAIGVLILVNFYKKSVPVEPDQELEIVKFINLAKQKLEQGQAEDGAWPAAPFYIGASPVQLTSSEKVYAGSQALSTAFCLVALERAREFLTRSQEQQKDYHSQDQNQISRVKQLFNQRLRQVSDSKFQRQGREALEQISQSGRLDEIVTLPKKFARAVTPLLRKNLSTEEHEQKFNRDWFDSLALANLYGWLAYTIYDDFYDNEGQMKFLPVANYCLRETTGIFLSMNLGEDFNDLFKKTLNKIDSANLWEVDNCNFDLSDKKTQEIDLKKINIPDYGSELKNLSDRSLGHALSALASLIRAGYETASEEVETATRFFRAYLTARQLHDDIHDWEDDLHQGRINPAGARILLVVAQTHPNRETLTLDPDNPDSDLDFLRSIFWRSGVIDQLTEQILLEVNKAVAAAQKLEGTSSEFLKDLLTPLKKGAVEALAERDQAAEFIKAFD